MPERNPLPTTELLTAIQESALPLDDGDSGCGQLLELIGDARFVLPGEASHGTHEFYQLRAALSRRLIEDKGCTAVAVEADRPVLLEVYTDPDVPPLPPHITFEQAKAYTQALLKGDPDAGGIIRQSAKSLWQSFKH